MSDKRRARRRQLDASHQRSWLTGRYAVSEVLKAGVWPYVRLCATPDVCDSLSDLLMLQARRAGQHPDVESVTSDRLTELCGSRHHQGVAAQMGPFPYRSLDDLQQLMPSAPADVAPPVVVICDRIQDAHNLGAILRSCDAMAVSAVVIAERDQVGMTPQVARSSAGAVNHVPVVRVAQLLDAVAEVKRLGFQLLAGSEKSTMPVWEVEATRPTAVIIGSEARGVAEGLLSACDQQVAIPMLGRVASLNAAVAAGMLLYELRRKRD